MPGLALRALVIQSLDGRDVSLVGVDFGGVVVSPVASGDGGGDFGPPPGL